MVYNFENADNAQIAEIIQNGLTQSQAAEIAATIAAASNKSVDSYVIKSIIGTNLDFGTYDGNISSELYVGKVSVCGDTQGNAQHFTIAISQDNESNTFSVITQDSAGHVFNFSGAFTGCQANGSSFFTFSGWKFTLFDL